MESVDGFFLADCCICKVGFVSSFGYLDKNKNHPLLNILVEKLQYQKNSNKNNLRYEKKNLVSATCHTKIGSRFG